jgi:hypothetical protein
MCLAAFAFFPILYGKNLNFEKATDDQSPEEEERQEK